MEMRYLDGEELCCPKEATIFALDNLVHSSSVCVYRQVPGMPMPGQGLQPLKATRGHWVLHWTEGMFAICLCNLAMSIIHLPYSASPYVVKLYRSEAALRRLLDVSFFSLSLPTPVLHEGSRFSVSEWEPFPVPATTSSSTSKRRQRLTNGRP